MPPKEKAQPGMPMRPLHWAKIPDVKLKDTIWIEPGFDDKNAQLDATEIESVFGMATKARAAMLNRGGAAQSLPLSPPSVP